MNKRRLIVSGIIAALIILPGSLVLYDLLELPWSERLQFGLFPLFPGIVPALILGVMGMVGNAHDPSPTVTSVISFAFWLWLIYNLLLRREKKRVS